MDEPKKTIPGTGRGTGRARGSKNILPPLGKSAKLTLLNILAFDDETVARTGQINGKGVHARQRLFETLHGLRPATPHEFIEALRFVWDRAIGLPAKAPLETVERKPVIFLGVPWDPENPHNKRMNARSEAMIKAKEEQLALEAADRKAAEIIDVEPAKGEPEDEGLERVIPPPAEDPSAYR